MRPRKRILIYGANDFTLSILRIVLESKRYAVETVMSFPAPDAFLLIGFNTQEKDAFEAQRWHACPQSGVAIVPSRGIHPEWIWIGEMLHRLHLATCRKRGPKPAKQRPELASCVADYAEALLREKVTA